MTPQERLKRIYELQEEILKIESDVDKQHLAIMKRILENDNDEGYATEEETYISEGRKNRRLQCLRHIGDHVSELMRLDQGAVVIHDDQT